MGWQFAIVNGRLAEIYFDDLKGRKRKIRAHCYVNEETRWTREEKQWIVLDRKRNRFSYRNKQTIGYFPLPESAAPQRRIKMFQGLTLGVFKNRQLSTKRNRRARARLAAV